MLNFQKVILGSPAFTLNSLYALLLPALPSPCIKLISGLIKYWFFLLTFYFPPCWWNSHPLLLLPTVRHLRICILIACREIFVWNDSRNIFLKQDITICEDIYDAHLKWSCVCMELSLRNRSDYFRIIYFEY